MRIVWWRIVLLGAITVAAGAGAWFAFTSPPAPEPAAARESAGPGRPASLEPTVLEFATPSLEPSVTPDPPADTQTRTGSVRTTARPRPATPRPSSVPRPTRTPSIGGMPGMGAGGSLCEDGSCPGQ